MIVATDNKKSTQNNQPLIDIENLKVNFGSFSAVDGLDLQIPEGQILGIVGESGSGKSVTMLALMGLVGYPGVVTADKLNLGKLDLLTINDRRRRDILGKDISMIFQEPLTSLNPSFTVGFQIMETLQVHEGGSKKQRLERTVELLDQVGIPDPRNRLDSYPHQLSGGMNQRIMIAMAIACNPKVLIADEPTTALDVTIQAQILDLLVSLQEKRNMTLILITHDMGVVAETAHEIAVMYAGQVMEKQPVQTLFTNPKHPYTQALLEALPERAIGKSRLSTIPGIVPGANDRPIGCLFHPRCRYADKKCIDIRPSLEFDRNSSVRCHYPLGSSKSKEKK